MRHRCRAASTRSSRSQPRAQCRGVVGSRCRRCRRCAVRRAPWNMPRSPAVWGTLVHRELKSRRRARRRHPDASSRTVTGIRARAGPRRTRAANRDSSRRCPTGPMISSGRRSRRQLSVAPREEQRREVDEVVGVEVRERDVRDRPASRAPRSARRMVTPLPQSMSRRTSPASTRWPACTRPRHGAAVPVPTVVSRIKGPGRLPS